MVDEHKPRHKPMIEETDCEARCLFVDGILVPHCDCKSHAWKGNE